MGCVDPDRPQRLLAPVARRRHRRQAPTPEVTFGAAPQLVLKLAETVAIYGWFGSQCQARVIGVQVDKPGALLARLEPRPSLNEAARE